MAISLVSVQSPSSGNLEMLENGRIRYTPPQDFQGAVRFQYTITDGDRKGTGWVYIAIYPPLEAKDLLFRISENEALELEPGDLLTNNSGEVAPPAFEGQPIF